VVRKSSTDIRRIGLGSPSEPMIRKTGVHNADPSARRMNLRNVTELINRRRGGEARRNKEMIGPQNSIFLRQSRRRT
jgi:hypothetical protein